ncbi:putative protein kinase RLK-Pelle-LRR-XII-1 family [Helianthus annuus]|nr:putative protein kinase RLK-Pelle-LRR-XII-1 family [Helianthus annuus]
MAFLLHSLVVIFLTTPTISTSDGGNETDHQALLSFKSMITEDPNRSLTSWNSSVHFCDWVGVTCGKRHRRVTVIQLESQGLVGSLSPHVGNLSFLRQLYLTNNSFHGSIPHELGRLSRLRVLNLGVNKFNGFIPTNLSACSNLKELSLWGNRLVGSIPKEISFLSELTDIELDDNDLTGGIPPFLGNISSMQAFSVVGNPFGGSVPDTLGRWKNLRTFYAGGCNLHGSIPHSIFNLSLLTGFSLAENQLTGSLPLAMGTMLPQLVRLQIRSNNLTGLIPPSISNCSKLQVLEMSINDFNGKLTIDFSELKDIYAINDNKLGGHGEADEMKFIDSLKNCSRLKSLNLNTCNFQVELPISIGNLSEHLSSLNLARNQLHGNLPLSIGNLVGLTNLHLGGNRFTGKIPFTIGKLQNLGVLTMYNNQLAGLIPDAAGNLSMLIKLDLHTNRLEGHIPSSLGNCHYLSKLDLSNNTLVDKIPKQILQLPSLTIRLDLSQNSLSGSLPTYVGDLKMLNYLILSFNKLSGNIPSSLGGCTSLSLLFLNDNLFDGEIPQSLSSLKGVEGLDFAHNNLSGQIPQFLERFFLEFIDLSYNDFVGKVPVLGVFANRSKFSILGNSRLCGGLVELGLPKCKEIKKPKKWFPLFIIVILSAFAIFATLCFVYCWIKKKGNTLTSQSLRKGLFLKVSYNQLLKATDGFSEANLIGQGGFSSVYKGTLNDDDGNDIFVVVKVLHRQNQGACKSFMRECEVWRSIRHRNLLKIITSCSSVDFEGNDFKALVYEFMPNGSLHDWLHSSTSTQRLSLLQRINILIDVAIAVNYLHNHCPITISHGDLKPSNILLDDDMVAHVGDFGLAQILGTDSNDNSTGVKGTIGYAPPEYGLGSEMKSSGDVYSFGITLLEVMTGKKPTDDIFNEDLSLHKLY